MKAIILAAGIGSRLRPMTLNKPKCLVKVAGIPIIDYQIRSYIMAGIEEIIVVTGYMSDKVKDFCNKYCNFKNFKIIENSDYDTTNNMYSLYLARQELIGENFILSNGDIVFDKQIAINTIQSKMENLIVADQGSYNEESMKITLEESGYINDISKTISRQMAYGNSIDMYKFSSDASKILFDEIINIIEYEKSLKEWTELALQRLLKADMLKMYPLDISTLKWVEIDNYEDLALADKLFSLFDISLKGKKLFFIDGDGTIYNGNKLINGTKDFLRTLIDLNISYYLLSNNSSLSKNDYVKKLKNINIDIIEDNVILSTDGLIEFLLSKNVNNIFLVGTKSMENNLIQRGINTRSNLPEYVVIGYDTELTYDKLKFASLYIQKGIDILATHCDIVCPTPDGPIPDIGSILALIETSTGKRPIKIFGKPNIEMVGHIIERHRVTEKEIVVIGDRLYTDMKLAQNIGCDFICVLSGDTRRDDIENIEEVPELIIKNISEIAIHN